MIRTIADLLLPVLAVLGIAAAGAGLFYYKTQRDYKRIDRLVFSMKMGLDYIRSLREKDQQAKFPKLYKKINQERKELEELIDRHSSKMDKERYQEALQVIHVAAALQPQGNFLTEVAGGVLDFVDDLFPEAEKVTSKLRPGNRPAADAVYDVEDDIKDPTLKKTRYIQQLAPEILEVYTKIERNRNLIAEKLEAANLSNKAELLAIHEGNMRNYEDVLSGYLKIRQEPTQYYKADERLNQARLTLLRVNEILTETLKQINENDMMNFEISLRLLQKER